MPLPTSHDSRCELRRTVRLVIPIHPPRSLSSRPHGDTPSWTAPDHATGVPSAWSATDGMAHRFDIKVAVRGEPDPTTGYLIDIGVIDLAVRAVVGVLSRSTPLGEVLAGHSARDASRDAPIPPTGTSSSGLPAPGAIVRTLINELPSHLGRPVARVSMHLAPFLHLGIRRVSTDRILLRQSFEFAASHRLHCPEHDDATNRAIFGKCNNPNGHGHNYRLEVGVEVRLADDGTTIPSLGAIEGIVQHAVVDRLDHTHLNLDVEAFRTLNPSVEHIARVCHGWLQEPIAGAGGALRNVVLWETAKTCCEYPIPAPE